MAAILKKTHKRSITYINRMSQNNVHVIVYRFVLKLSIILELRLYFSCHLENSGHIEKLRDGSIANFNQWVELYIS